MVNIYKILVRKVSEWCEKRKVGEMRKKRTNICIMLERKSYAHVDYVAMCSKHENNAPKRQNINR